MNKRVLKNLIKEVTSVVIESHYEDDPRDEMGRVQRPDVSYDTVSKKGEVNKIIANLQAHSSGAFTKIVQRLQLLQRLEDEIEELKEEVKQSGVREKINALFGVEYQFVTRVVKLASLIEVTMSKNPKETETTKWREVYEELYQKLPQELQEVGTGIVKKFSTVHDPKPASLKVKDPSIKESADNWQGFEQKMDSWGNKFDEKLDHVLDGLIQSAQDTQ